jgi:hypothetical protein
LEEQGGRRMTNEELREVREQKISKDLKTIENFVRHAFNQGYGLGYQQHGKDFVEKGEKAYQQGLEDGRKQGVAIDGDKRYWDGYHAAQEDGQKIYQKGLDDAWTAARKIILRSDKGGMVGLPFDNCFKDLEYFDCDDLLYRYSASEVIEKIREYEEKQKRDCDTCAHNTRSWWSEECDGCTVSDSHYVCADDPIKPEKTVYPESPCDLCRFNPPGSGDGKPCTMCPAEGRSE